MRTLKKTLCLVLVLAMVLSCGILASADFTDAKQIKNTEAVDVLVALGVIEGYPDGSFQPEGTLTRAEAVTILTRLLGQDDLKGRADYTDLQDSEWAESAIAYCTNLGIVDGVGDGKFNPTGTLTGYQWAKMLLGALGYKANIEGMTGGSWEIAVAKLAKETGIFGNDTSDKTQPVSRDDACAWAFNALFTQQVRYPSVVIEGEIDAIVTGTNAKPVPRDKTLGEDVFNLSAGVETDEWGRPSYVYRSGAKNSVLVAYPIAPVATYNVATSQCKLASDLGLKKAANVTVYDNGVERVQKIDPLSLAATEGAQGTLIEVYTDRIVVIDTYLAVVTAVNETRTDPAGHLIKNAYSDVAVYGLTLPQGVPSVIDSTEYARGTYILVNYNEEYEFIQDVQEAPSFVGAQTKIWYNTDKHDIEGKTYDDAAHFALDAANVTEVVNFTWFLDQYGNVIGSAAINRTSYAVLKDIIWEVGKPGYAEAVLVAPDGTESTVTVVRFDGLVQNIPANAWPYGYNGWSGVTAAPVLSDSTSAFPGVSEDTRFNVFYEGYALYQVYTADNGTVSLNSADVRYAHDAVIDNNSGVIWVGGANVELKADNNGAEKVYVTGSTQFVVRNADNTYSTYTRANVPEFESNTEIFYTVDRNGVAGIVYVKNGVIEAERGDHLFVTNDTYATYPGTGVWEMSVVIDGVERDILADRATVEKLAANVGKLFHVEWKLNPYDGFYGFVDEVRLVNEPEDSEWCCDYLSTISLATPDTLVGDRGIAYVIDENTVVIGNGGKIDASKGIWVISDNSRTQHADIVYVGTKLDESTALTVVAKDGKVEVNPVDPTQITVTSLKDATSDVLTYIANDANSVVIAPSVAGLGVVSETVYENNPGRAVTVWNEAGTRSVDYNVTLVWLDRSDNTALASVYVDTTNAPIPGVGEVVYLDSKAAFTVTATAADPIAKVEIGSGTTVELAIADLAVRAGNQVTVTETTAVNGGYVVIRVTAENGATQLYVYSTDAAPVA